jgi:hypothetical protein
MSHVQDAQNSILSHHFSTAISVHCVTWKSLNLEIAA